jgi:predicted esterase
MDITLRHITVKKTARYFMLGEPGPFTRQVWFVCHGYGFLAGDFLKNFEALNEKQHLVVAPEGLHRFYLFGTGGKVGASWMTKEDRLNDINDYIHYLDDTYAEIMKTLDINRVKVTALGFSQGTATVSRWVLAGSSSIHRLVLWGGDFPPDIDWDAAARRLNHLQVQLVFGTEDPYLKNAALEKQSEQLKRYGVNFQIKTFYGGHEIHAGILTSLAR